MDRGVNKSENFADVIYGSTLGNIAAKEWPCGGAACADWKIGGEEGDRGKSGAKKQKGSRGG